MIKMKQKTDLSELSPKKIQKVLMEIDKMADVYLSRLIFGHMTFLNFAPPSIYTLNLRTLKRCQKLKFMFSKKATKTDEIFPVNLTFTT